MNLSLYAQDVQIALNFPNDPPANPFMWDDESGLLVLDIINNENNNFQVELVIGIEEVGGEPVAFTDPSMIMPFQLNPFEMTTLMNTEVGSISALNYQNPDVVANQELPPGDYVICIQAIFNPGAPDMFELSDCQQFTIQQGVVNLNTNLSLGDPPALFAGWDDDFTLMSINIENNAGPVDVFLVGFLNSDEEGLVATTNPMGAPVLNLLPGLNTFNGPQALPVSAMDILSTSLMNSGMLIPGNYELCLDVVSAVDEMVVDGPVCANFTIEQAPVDIMTSFLINGQVPANVNTWESTPGLFAISTFNNGRDPINIGYAASIFSVADGSLLAQSNPLFIPEFNLQVGPNDFDGTVAIPSSGFDLFPPLSNSGVLFPGTYDICLDVLDADGNILEGPICAQFDIEQIIDPEFPAADLLCPTLVTPFDNTTISEIDLVNTVFQWMPSEADPFRYNQRFTLVEVLPGQSAGEALQNNNPFIEATLNGDENIFIWPDDEPAPICDQEYAWTVTLIDILLGQDDFACIQEAYKFLHECWGTVVVEQDTIIPDSIRNDSLPVPGIPDEPTYPPETTSDGCNQIQVEVLNGTDPELGVVLSEPEKFKYPRAVALRAEGIDWDLVRYTCSGCSANESIKEVAVRDLVGDYQWELIGKGQLNDPYDLTAIDSIQDTLSSILARLEQIEEELEQIDEDTTTNTPDAIASMERKISQLEEQVAEQTAECDSLDRVSAELELRIRNLETLLTEYYTIVEESWEAYLQLSEDIDTLERFLDGEPGSNEIQQADKVSGVREELENLKQQLLDKEAEIIARAEELQAAITDAQRALQVAANDYQVDKETITRISEQIRSLEQAQLANPDIRQFILRKREFSRKATTFISRYSSSGSGLAAALQDLNSDLMSYASKSKTSRDSVDIELLSTLTSFMSNLNSNCTALSSEAATACSQELQQVYQAKSALAAELINLLSVNATYNRAIAEQIVLLQGEISGLTGSLNGKKAAMNSAEAAYEQVIQQFSAELLALEIQRDELATNVQLKSDELTEEEEILNQMRQRRLDDLDQNYATYVAQLKSLREEHQDTYTEWESAQDSISTWQTDTIHLNSAFEVLKTTRETCRSDLQQLKDILDIARNKLQQLRNSLLEARKKAEELQKEKKDLEQARQDAEEELKQKLADGNKKASGPLVYYIPPPLEEILQHPEKFDSLTANVHKKESELEAAYASKEGLQGKIVKLMNNIGNDLVTLKRTIDQIGPFESSIAEATDQLSKDKTDAQQEVIDDYNELIDLADDYREKIEQIRLRIQQLVTDSTTTASEVKRLKAEIETALDDVDNKRETLLEKMSQKEYEETQVKNGEGTLARHTEDLRKLKAELEVKYAELGRAQNDQSRASSQEDDQAVQTASNLISTLRDDIALLEGTTIPTKEASVASAASSVEASTNRLKAAKEQADAAWKAWNDAVNALNHEKRDALVKANEKLKKITSDLIHERKKLKIAEGHLDRSEQDIRDKKDKTDEMVNGQDDIKAAQASLDEMKQQLEALKRQKTKMEREIEDAVAKKKRWVKEAEERVAQAKGDLKAARIALTDYLRDEEFKVVDLEVQIKLKAKDQGVDQWRTKEGEKELLRKLKYPKDRIPTFNDKVAANKKPPEIVQNSVCFPAVDFSPPGPFEGVKNDIGTEPRTIALMYRDGEPLWQEWPDIPKDAPRLSKDVLKWHTTFTNDQDQKIFSCASASEKCPPSKPNTVSITDLKSYDWTVEGKVISQHPYLASAFWEPAIIPIPIPEKQQVITATATANEIAGDDAKTNRSEPLIKPGVMIEWTKSLTGKPDTALDVQARVVQGDHEPLLGEDIEFEVRLIAGTSEGFGFEDDSKKFKTKTKEGGYARTKFKFGDGYAEYEFTVRWYRGTTIVQEEKFKGKAPLYLKLHHLGNGPPEVAWQATEKLFSGSGLSEALNTLPETSDESSVESLNKQMHAIAGLLNGFKSFVDEEKILFETNKPETITLDPEEDVTRIIGIARTQVDGLPDDPKKEFEFDVTATVEDKYTDIAQPAEQTKSYSTKGVREFYIGNAELPFLVEADEEFNPNELFSGSCHLKLDVEQLGLSDLIPKDYIIDPLKEITLLATDIKLEAHGEKYTATEGKVTWRGAEGLEFEALSFTIRIDSLSLKANVGGEIGGSLKHASHLPDPVGYSAVLEPTGDFIGTLSNLPELSLSDFKLKQGSAFSIDMHEGQSPGLMEKSFKGVLIHTAQMELPELLSRRIEGEKPSELAVKDFYIGTSIRQGEAGSISFGGEVSYSGALFEIGYAGFDLSASDITLVFDNNELTEGNITGAVNLPSPMAGKIKLEIAKAGTTWAATPETEEPVALPRLGTTLSLLTGTGITYDTEKQLGTLTINAYANSKDYGKIEIKDFQMNNLGKIEGTVTVEEATIEYKGGFRMTLRSLAFNVEPGGEEYKMELGGAMAFPTIGIEDLTGKLILSPGPSLDVELESATIEFDKNPVTFKGELSFTAREFKGEFDIGIKKVIPNGLSGLLIIGNTEDVSNATYNYWYAELSAGAIIPLGQTGTAILEIGGGVGYNYNPPVGGAPGSPSNTESFSFKAIVGAGNFPGNGNLFAGRLEMVLAAPVFTMYGKVWVLDSEKNIYGDGTLKLNWDAPSVSGDVGMFIGLPDAEGDAFMFRGKIIFMYSSTETYIRSQEISGSAFKYINGEGHFDINSEFVEFGGKLDYSFNEGIGFSGILKALIAIDVGVRGNFKYENTPQRLTIDDTYFKGSWDVDLETPLGTADVTSGGFEIRLDVVADPQHVEVNGTGRFDYDVFIYAGSLDFEVGYRSP